MKAVWRRAWRSRASSTGISGSGGGGYLPATSGSSTTGTASGTTLSTTTYPSDRVGGRPLVVKEHADQERDMELKEELVATREHITRVLVGEFCGGANGHHASASEKWLWELDVDWLLHLAEIDASEGRILVTRELMHLTRSWIPALWTISTSIWGCFGGFHSQEEATVGLPAASEFVRFFEATLLKMFTFVHAIAPLNLDDPSIQEHIVPGEVATENLRALLDVRGALSTASEQIIMSFHSSPFVQSTRITDDMKGLLSAELGRVDQAVLDTVDQIRNAAMSYLNDSSSWATTPLASPDIHKVTRSTMKYITVLSANLQDPIIGTIYADDAPPHEQYLDTLIDKMVHSLEEKLARVSQSFPDQSLGFLSLINNSYFIQRNRGTGWLFSKPNLKVERYMQSYVQVTWAPVLQLLHNPPLHCFTRNSHLPKFESKFKTTCDAQKLWKVPDPEMRKMLRQAIIKEVTSGFTKYLEDNSDMTTLTVTAEKMEEMLQELFEG
jgi:hypothetical protein